MCMLKARWGRSADLPDIDRSAGNSHNIDVNMNWEELFSSWAEAGAKLNITMNASDPGINGSMGAPLMKSWAEIMAMNAPVALTVDRVISPIWYVIGLIGNPISFRIWLDRKVQRNNSSAIYLGTLAIVQFVFLFLHMLTELLFAWDVTTYNRPVLCELFNFVYLTVQYLVPLVVLGFTVERYIAVCHPFIKERFCTVSRAVKVNLGLIGLAAALGSPQIYIWTYDENTKICGARDKDFMDVWTWVSEILIFAVVPVTVLIFNIIVILEIKRLTSDAEMRMPNQTSTSGSPASTVTLLSVSFYLICTLLPATIVYSLQSFIPSGPEIGFELWPTDPGWITYFNYMTVRKIVEEICMSNYACYVFIYYITGPHFRRIVNKMFHCDKCERLIKRRSQSPSSDCSRKKKTSYQLVSSNGQTLNDSLQTQC